MPELSYEQRQEIVRQLARLEAQMFGKENSAARQAASSQHERLLAAYAESLPRLPLSCCPFCAAPLVRTFDPWGLDGPWWWEARIFKLLEPPCCPHFKVLLGAVDLRGRTPLEVQEQVYPGPGAPFVVPDLLQLPAMKAVVGKISLATGDTAYPIAYFSPEKIHPAQLHQPWGRLENWFTDEDGHSGWNSSNSVWDFDLAPHLATGQVSWVDLSAPALPRSNTLEAPWGPNPGVRAPQQIVQGQAGELPLPSGESGCPFEE